MQIPAMAEPKNPYWEQGRRLRWLRLAKNIDTGTAFARWMNWPQSGYSQFETGARPVPRDKALDLSRKIPGFDPMWLWHGEKRGLSFELLRLIEEQEALELPESRREQAGQRS